MFPQSFQTVRLGMPRSAYRPTGHIPFLRIPISPLSLVILFRADFPCSKIRGGMISPLFSILDVTLADTDDHPRIALVLV